MIEEIIQSMIIISFESICCKYYLDALLHKKEYLSNWMKKLMIPIMALGLISVATFIQNYLIKSILIILVIVITVQIYYYATSLQNLVLSGLYYGMLVGIDYIAILLITNLFSENYVKILNNNVSATIVALLCKMILFLAVLIIRKKWKTEDCLDVITNKEWIRLSYFPLFTIISMISILASFDYNDKISKVLLIIAFGLVTMNFIVFFIIQDIVNREFSIRNSRLIQERTKNQMNIYRNMHDTYERQRKRIHDYKNQLVCIQGMLVNGNIKETMDYITNLTGSLIKDMDTIHTNHAVADSVLNQKYRYAQSKGIILIFIVNDLSKLTINEEDLVTILSNLLDNAIEACEKVESNKIIKFKMTDEKNQLIISIKNPVNEPLNIINNRIATTKENRKEHGVGLLNIYTVIDKYNGTYAIKNREESFYFSTLIPYSK